MFRVTLTHEGGENGVNDFLRQEFEKEFAKLLGYYGYAVSYPVEAPEKELILAK